LALPSKLCFFYAPRKGFTSESSKLANSVRLGGGVPMKVCTKCNFDYPAPIENFFSKKAKTKDGLQHICKACNKLNLEKHYKANKAVYIAKAIDRNKKIRIETRQYVWDHLKTHSCVDCGEKDPVVLEFDHLRDKHKDISSMIHDCYCLETIKIEIEKCEVRCANCHRRKTAIQFGWYKDVVI
jgi:hypothetical protein